MPVTLETVRTVLTFFQRPMFGAPLQSLNGQVFGVGEDMAFEDIFCSVSLSFADAVLWLLA